MSSHHIVREKQEPALVIMTFDDFEAEYLGQLLEWSPTVIVNDQVYEHADSLGIKIDAVISPNPHFNAQENTRIILTETDPLEDCLKFLVGEGYPAVNIITSDFLIKDYALFTDRIDIVVFIGNQKIFPVRSGFSKWMPGGEKIVVMHEISTLGTSGLRQIGDSTYETEKDGFYSFTFDQPWIFIAEHI